MKIIKVKNQFIKLIVYIFLVTFIFAFDSTTSHAAPRLQPVSDKVVIVIDPGHGGNNEGTKENGFLEKAMTLTTATAMYNELKKFDNAEVYMTRTTDMGMSLEERAEYAKSVNADFLFSIHYNASLSHELYGTEVWASIDPTFRTYGYQFGCVQMETMKDFGLFIRGTKSRVGDEGDYYGILRYSCEQDIPAVIIEHCHVDNKNDEALCDSTEDLEAFGRADALSVAKYFGLYSTELGVDYRDYSATSLADTSPSGSIRFLNNDGDGPDFCQAETTDIDYNSGNVKLTIFSTDYNGILLFYDYSIDGGTTYSERIPWPNADAVAGTYPDTITMDINIPSKTKPTIIFRTYNMYDLFTESEPIELDEFIYGEDAIVVQGQAKAEGIEQLPDASAPDIQTIHKDKNSVGTTTFRPDETIPEEKSSLSFITFIIMCIIVVVLVLATVIISQIITDSRRRKRRRQRRNDSGNSKYHNK